MQSNSTESSAVEYRDIEGFPGYRVGNDGTVWSLWTGSGRGSFCGTEWRQLKPSRNRDRRKVGIRRNDGKRKILFIHRLVLTAFIGPCPKGMECCHNDGNPANNRLDNLRWDTPKSNNADKILHGTRQNGERCWLAKLTWQQAREMREIYDRGGVLQTELAVKYSVSPNTVSRVIRSICWVE